MEIPEKQFNKKEFLKILSSLFLFLKSKWGILTIPKIKFLYDKNNADDIFGKTGYYDLSSDTICLYILKRHPKDILRTFCHEMRHKFQHEKNMFNIKNERNLSVGYAQSNNNLRNAEKDAFMNGCMAFRDFEDGLKK